MTLFVILNETSNKISTTSHFQPSAKDSRAHKDVDIGCVCKGHQVFMLKYHVHHNPVG